MNDADYEELVLSLTPTESVGGVKSYRNTVNLSCPACEKGFDDLVICQDEYNSLELSQILDLCVTTHDDDVLVFTHKK